MFHYKAQLMAQLFTLVVVTFPHVMGQTAISIGLELVESHGTEQPLSNLTATSNQMEPQPPSIIQLASRSIFFKSGRAIQTFGMPCVVVVGLVANVLSFVVMVQPANRRISCCIYMATVAVCDTCVLMLVINLWSTTLGVKLVVWTNLQCKVIGYLVHSFAMCSVLLVTFVTADRFIAVRFPLHAKVYCTTSRAKKVCFGIVILVKLCQIPHLRYMNNNGPTCQAFGFRDSWALIFFWFNASVMSIMPFVVLCILNGLIIMSLRARARSFGKKAANCGDHSAENEQESSMGARSRQMVTLLLLVTSAMLILTMPQFIRYIIYLFIDNKNNPRAYALYYFWYNVTQVWIITNHAINFFLYCVGGSKFREDLKGIFTCRKK